MKHYKKKTREVSLRNSCDFSFFKQKIYLKLQQQKVFAEKCYHFQIRL